MAHQRIGLYLHMLPTARQARKVVWDAITKQGERLIDQAFPVELRDGDANNTDMKIKLRCGSIYQVVGSDNYDSLVGTNPVGVIFSEYALSDPAAWNYIRPILRENDGVAIFISTPRGQNHFYEMCEMAKRNDSWFYSFKTYRETGVVSDQDIQEERDSWDR